MVPRNRRDDATPKTMSDDRPTVADLQHEGLFTELARHHWLQSNQRTTKVKVKNDLLKNEIWDVLAQNDFQYRYLLELDNLQILERYATTDSKLFTLAKFDQLFMARLFGRCYQSPYIVDRTDRERPEQRKYSSLGSVLPPRWKQEMMY